MWWGTSVSPSLFASRANCATSSSVGANRTVLVSASTCSSLRRWSRLSGGRLMRTVEPRSIPVAFGSKSVAVEGVRATTGTVWSPMESGPSNSFLMFSPVMAHGAGEHSSTPETASCAEFPIRTTARLPPAKERSSISTLPRTAVYAVPLSISAPRFSIRAVLGSRLELAA